MKAYTNPMRSTGLSVVERHVVAPVAPSLSGTRLPLAGLAAFVGAAFVADVDVATGPPSRGAPV